MTAPLMDQPLISKADRVRERELFRYYQPRQDQSSDSCAAPKPSTSPDIALTALAQLVAIRLRVRSVLIKFVLFKLALVGVANVPSVITKDTQYTLSEGTKTLNLDDTLKSEAPSDALWIGQRCIPKHQSLCQVGRLSGLQGTHLLNLIEHNQTPRPLRRPRPWSNPYNLRSKQG